MTGVQQTRRNCLETSQLCLHSDSFVGQGGERKMKQGKTWDDKERQGQRKEWRVAVPSSFCLSPPSSLVTDKGKGKGARGREAGGAAH